VCEIQRIKIHRKTGGEKKLSFSVFIYSSPPSSVFNCTTAYNIHSLFI